ncbi:YtxH domain-containing protein [Marisediminicola senii]|uniref:YtxH domain-containing protein n=1 Tax=Marisediminicola senii TaxID=2711233 RepID=UPI0013ED8D2C|nr:hypothetical protein [Marisediminicola senii]
MRGKLTLVAGLAVGYVLGSRAGRERYEQIKKATDKFWNSTPVQRRVQDAEGFVKDKAPEVVDFVTGNVKKAVSKTPKKNQVSGSNTPASSPSA